MAIFNTMQQTCNGINDTALPMWIILITNVVNIAGNWILIFGHFGAPELGLAGAGYSTLLARCIGAIGILFIFFYRKKYKSYTAGCRRSVESSSLRRRVWFTSYPVMIQSGIECAMWSFGAVVCGWFGKIQLAAYQVVNTIAQLGFMTFISFGTATSIRVANFTGQNDWISVRRVTKAGLILNLLLATAASLFFIFGGSWLIGCFTPDHDVIAAALLLIPPLVIYQYMDATQLTYCNAIRGTSKVKPLLWISVGSYVVIGTPVALLFAVTFGWESIGVYYSFDVALLAASVAATLVFRRILRVRLAA